MNRMEFRVKKLEVEKRRSPVVEDEELQILAKGGLSHEEALDELERCEREAIEKAKNTRHVRLGKASHDNN